MVHSKSQELAQKADAQARGKVLDPPTKRAIAEAWKVHQTFEATIHECLCFADGDQYAYQSGADGRVHRLETREGTTKPRWRIRQTRNRVTKAVTRKASRYAARTPPWEVTPISLDPEAVDGSRFAEKALLAKYHELDLHGMAMDTFKYSFETGAGITWPFWDEDTGEFVVDDEGNILRTGEIRTEVLHLGEVTWQPGRQFYDARFHVVRKAQNVAEVNAKYGLQEKPNATAAPYETRRGQERGDLIYVQHYLERPSRKHIRGRYLVLIGERVVHDGPYPIDVDECVLQWVPYVTRRHRERPMGMVEQLLDIQRTINRTVSQIIAYKNLVLVPQVIAAKGSIDKTKAMTDEPGAIVEHRQGTAPQWRDMPEMPQSFFATLDQAISDWNYITGESELPNDIESGSVVAGIEQHDESGNADFGVRVANWWSRLGMAHLRLMAKHYTEPRMLQVQGRYSVEMVSDFMGAMLHGWSKVYVAPGAIEPRSRLQQQGIIMNLVDRGLVPHEQAIMALNAGTADVLIDAYELNVDKQKREIGQLVQMGSMQGPGVPMVDPIADDHAVHLDMIKKWMVTRDYETQPEAVKEAARVHAQWHEQEQMKQAMAGMMLASAQAEQNGMMNAAGGGVGGPPPPGASQPSLESSTRAANGTPSREKAT